MSNLENPFPGAAGAIGDIHSVTPYGPTTVGFSTGNQETLLRAITLEFYVDSRLAGSWNSVDVQLRTPGGSTVMAHLGTPRLNPGETQWPQGLFPNGIYTQLVDFQPAGSTYLPPLTDLEFVVSRRSGSPSDSGVLYTKSETYSSVDGWKMGATTSANPFAIGQFLKFAIVATAVPEPSGFSIVGLGLSLMFLRRRSVRV